MRQTIAVILILGTLGFSIVARSATPAPSGLLIATNLCAEPRCGQFYTYWIVRDGNTVRVAAQGQGLLAPRKDGFWWVGLERGFGGNMSAEDGCPPEEHIVNRSPESAMPKTLPNPNAIWAVRAGQAAEFKRLSEQVLQDKYEGTGEASLTLHWVGTDWVSVNSALTATRYSITYQDDDFIVPFDALRKPLTDSFADALTFSGAAYETAHRACRDALIAAGGDFNDADFIDSASRFWAIRRGPTSWILREELRYDTGAARGYATACQLPSRLVRSQIGYDRVTIPWSAVKNALPTAVTAFESPSGDLLLVFDGDVWHAFFPRNRNLGKEQARLRLPGTAVMTQWATGAHVARWTEQVAALLKAGPPKLRWVP